jgi:flagellar biosynthesis GTPase FlhF
MRFVLVCIASFYVADAHAQEPQARRQLLPTVRAATDCASRAIALRGIAASATDEILRDAARQAFGAQCQVEGQRLVAEHDRLYGPGTGRSFVDGAYFSDFPRAARIRMAGLAGQGQPAAKPARCPEMLEIYEVQDAGREFAEIERIELTQNPKSDAELIASFTARMDNRLRQARHVMATSVLQEFRRLPPSSLESCFPTLSPVLFQARAIALQREEQRREAERQREEAERQRAEFEWRRAEEQRIADERRAEELRLAELRRAEFQRAEEERRRIQKEEADRKRAEAQRVEEEQQREARRPANVLKRLYAQYAYVKQCYEFRNGYVSIFVSDNEFTRARTAIKAIETKLKSIDSAINTDFIWAEAASAISIVPERGSCQVALQSLMSAFQEIAPDAAAPKKDF